MAGNDVVFNIRERGARQTAQEVDRVGGRLGALGNQSARTAARAHLLGHATTGLRTPFRHLREEAMGLGKSVLGMGLAFGSVEGIKHSIETTDNLVKSTVQLKSQFGLTTQAASGLAGVLQTRGISPMALRMGFTTLSKAMQGSIDGTVAQKRAFRDMGISAAQVRSSMGTGSGLSHIFDLVTERMTTMHGGQKKAVDGQILLGRASKGLAPLLMEGALGMKQQEKWARQFGVTLSDKTVGGVEGMAAAQTKAQYAALGLQIQMGQLLAPALTRVNLIFADVVKSFRDGRPEGDKYARTIYKIGQDLKPVGHDLAVVGGFLKDHPALLRDAALGFVAYKTKLLSLLGFAPKAYLQGLISGRAYARGIQTGTAEGTAAQRAGWAGLGTRIGGFMAPAISAAILLELPNIYQQVGKALHLGPSFQHEAKRGYRDLIPGMEESAGGGEVPWDRMHALGFHQQRTRDGLKNVQNGYKLERLHGGLRLVPDKPVLRSMNVTSPAAARQANISVYIDGKNVVHHLAVTYGKDLAKGVNRANADQRARR